MKQIKRQRHYLPAKLSVLFSVVLCAFLMWGMIDRAAAAEKTIASTDDYSVKIVEESAGSCKIVFTPSKAASYVEVHYKVNGENQQNLPLAESSGSFEHEVKNVKAGDELSISFTYNTGSAYDTEWWTHTVGSLAGSGEKEESIRIEAEDYTKMSGVEKSGGEVTGIDTNDWMRHTVNVEKAGSYRILVHGKASGAKDGMLVFRDAQGRIAQVAVTKGGTDMADFRSEKIEFSAGELQLTTIAVAGGISVDWFALEPVSGSTENPGGSTEEPGEDTEDPGEPMDPSEVETPEADPTIPVQKDKIIFQFNNKTDGKYQDDQIYWCILGYDMKDPERKLCYVDAQGTLHPATVELNTIEKNGRMCADICNTVAENKYVYMPSIESGRMYISYGEQVYIQINKAADGNIGFAGPDLNNPSDPNSDVLFEFLEFTIGSKVNNVLVNPVEYWGNTTRVDNFCFPIVTRLIGENGEDAGKHYDTFDRMVGDAGTRAQLFAAFKKNAPEAFKDLASGNRIIAPCKGNFNEGKEYENYFQDYIDQFWTKYAAEDLLFECEGGKFQCRVEGDELKFTELRSNQTGTVQKPNTQEVLEGKGAFDSGTSIEKVLEAQLCAAFNRGVALHPENWYKPETYYQDESVPCNYYSKFWHEHSVDGHAYGFCYDDVFDQATLLHFTNPTSLVIDLKW